MNATNSPRVVSNDPKIALVKNALDITANAHIIQPGKTVSLALQPKLDKIPLSAVTGMLDELPGVTMSANIHLGGFANALSEAMQAIVRALPMPKVPAIVNRALERAGQSNDFSIPVTIEMRGTRLTKQLAPTIDQLIPIFSSGTVSDELKGILAPVSGSTLLNPLEFVVRLKSWTIVDKDNKEMPVVELPTKSKLLNSFMPVPPVRPLEEGKPLEPIDVKVKATVDIEIYDGLKETHEIQTTIKVLPIVCPVLAALFQICSSDTNPDHREQSGAMIVSYAPTDIDEPQRFDPRYLLSMLSQVAGIAGAISKNSSLVGSDKLSHIRDLSSVAGYLLEQLNNVPPSAQIAGWQIPSGNSQDMRWFFGEPNNEYGLSQIVFITPDKSTLILAKTEFGKDVWTNNKAGAGVLECLHNPFKDTQRWPKKIFFEGANPEENYNDLLTWLRLDKPEPASVA